MDDISQKIGQLLSDPSMMEQIRSLRAMLGSSQQESPAPPPQPSVQPQQNTLGALSPDMLGMMMKLAPLLSSMNEENDSTRLLSALRPFLSEKRRGRIDGSIRLLGLMRMLRQKQYHPMSQHQQVVVLCAALGHCMQNIPETQIETYVNRLIGQMEQTQSALCNKIDREGILTDAERTQIQEEAKQVAEQFIKETE